ncbi:MAG: hypothetical protein LBB11_03225 [Puniceicoccales bacterium]|jgi:hypothetical protein|nr:hypothetical protein [Puniceicoccales bacterium]
MFPCVVNGWNLVTYFQNNQALIISNPNASIIDDQLKATICIQEGENQSVQCKAFWLYLLDQTGKNYDPVTTRKDHFYFLPNVPMFVPVREDISYSYSQDQVGKELGKNACEILKPYGDIICCLQYPKTNSQIKNATVDLLEQMVFYRYGETNRYFFFAPAAKAHEILNKNDKEKFELRVAIDEATSIIDSKDNQIDKFAHIFTFQGHYVGENRYEFHTMNLKEKKGFALSGLVDQNWSTWKTKLIKNNPKKKWGLPGIHLTSGPDGSPLPNKNQNKWITTQVVSKNKVFLTHHIFLNQEFTYKIEKALFSKNDKLPEDLKDCNTSKYGEWLSLWAKLFAVEGIKSDAVLDKVLTKIEKKIKENAGESRQRLLTLQPILSAQNLEDEALTKGVSPTSKNLAAAVSPVIPIASAAAQALEAKKVPAINTSTPASISNPTPSVVRPTLPFTSTPTKGRLLRRRRSLLAKRIQDRRKRLSAQDNVRDKIQDRRKQLSAQDNVRDNRQKKGKQIRIRRRLLSLRKQPTPKTETLSDRKKLGQQGGIRRKISPEKMPSKLIRSRYRRKGRPLSENRRANEKSMERQTKRLRRWK